MHADTQTRGRLLKFKEFILMQTDIPHTVYIRNVVSACVCTCAHGVGCCIQSPFLSHSIQVYSTTAYLFSFINLVIMFQSLCISFNNKNTNEFQQLILLHCRFNH
jgi:hypothetical protein